MEKRWYAVQTYVGYEKRVKQALEQKSRDQNHADAFGEIVVPTEKIIDLVRGKKQTVERRLFPGYLFVEMELHDDTWHLIHSIPKIVGFIGESDGTPTPVPSEQVREIQQRVATAMAMPRAKTVFTTGDKVKVVDGPFRDFTGTVEVVKPDRARLRVAVSVFGRPTPIELDFLQVEAA